MSEEVTLTMLLDNSRELYQLLKEELEILNEGLVEIKLAIKETDKMVENILNDPHSTDVEKKFDRLEILKYKSMILQAKSELDQSKQEITKAIKDTIQIVTSCEKAIQLNTGDIF